MSRQAYNEYLALQHELAQLQPANIDMKDDWTYIWGQTGFSSSRYYQYIFSSLATPRTVTWIWKSKCVPKIKFFAWLLLNDRLNTRNMLRRRHKFLEEGYNCVLCLEGREETLEHLFFECPSSVTRWFVLGITWNEEAKIHEKLQMARLAFMQPFFMEVVMIGAWCIRKERNDFIFNGKVPSLSSWKATFKKEVSDHFCRIKPSLHQSIQLWLNAL